MYLDLIFCFFFISIPLLIGKDETEPSNRRNGRTQRTNIALQISPFLLNLNLNPLYSSLGGSTIRADPLKKKPMVVDKRLNPLYKWKVLSQRTFVLSEACIQVCFIIIT